MRWRPAIPSRLEFILFALLLIVYIWPRDLDLGPNVNAHLSQALAIAVDGTLSIDNYANSSFTSTIDWSRAPDGRLYPAKAPGCALALAPLMWMMVRAERAIGKDPLSAGAIWRKATLGNWILNAFPSALCMVLLFRIALGLGVPPPASLIGTLAVALGTAYHPYATSFYAHAPAANLLIIATATTFRRSGSHWFDVLGGVAAGFAVVFDYPAALAVAACTLAVLALRRTAVLAFVAGGLLPLLVLLTYHQLAFGSPLATPYQFQNPVFTPPSGSLFGGPSAWVLGVLLVSPYRGLLFYSPVLIAAIVGAVDLCRAGEDDRAQRFRRRVYVAFSLGTLAAWLLLNSSYFTWTGGATSGPRFVVPALVLLAPLIGCGWRRFPVITSLLLCWSVLNQLAIAAVWILTPERYSNPLMQVIYPRFIRGDFERGNLGLRFGLPGLWSIAPIALLIVAGVWLAWRETRGVEVPGA
jgi:hypothetical protein